MNYRTLKKLEQSILNMKKAKDVGTYQDLTDISVSVFGSIKENLLKDRMAFSVPNRRKDNHKSSSSQFMSFDDLIKLGVSHIYLLQVIESFNRKSKFEYVKNLIKSNNVRRKIPNKLIHIDGEREYSDAKIILSKLKKKRTLMPCEIRRINKKDPSDPLDIENKEFIRLKSIIARNKIDRVFSTGNNHLDEYISIPTKQTKNKYDYLFSFVKPLIAYEKR
jgi:hypothetical protein